MSRFAGGYSFLTNAAMTVGASLAPNGTSWAAISDSNKKCNVAIADGEGVLKRFSTLRLGSWNYKADTDAGNRHYGPMAQEWFAAFGNDGVGTIGCDTTLATLDLDGVAYIAIQALEKRTAEQKIRIEQLENSNGELSARLEREREDMNSAISEYRAALDALRGELSVLRDSLKRAGQAPDILQASGSGIAE
jgi:hypothetical protein